MIRFKSTIRDSSPLTGLFKTTGVVIIFFIAGILFWKNYEYTLEKIVSKQNIYDETKTLNKFQRRLLKDFAKYLKKTFGINFVVNIRKEELKPYDNLTNTLFIGIGIKKKECNIHFPILLKKSLPKDFVEYMEGPYCHELTKNTWPVALVNGIKFIYNQLTQLEHEYKKTTN